MLSSYKLYYIQVGELKYVTRADKLSTQDFIQMPEYF